MCLPCVSGESVTVARYQFESLVDFAETGTPSLVDGHGGGMAVELNEASISLPDYNLTKYSMLSAPGECSIGFTTKFDVQYRSFCENMYVLTTGGDQPDSTGVAVYYQRRSVYFTVSTPDKQWVVSVSRPQLNVFYTYRFSFSAAYGIDVNVGGKSYKTKTFYRRSVLGEKKSALKIGGPLEDGHGCYGNITFGGFEIYAAPTFVLDVLDVVTGEPTF